MVKNARIKLEEVVRSHMDSANDDDVRLVVSVAGLLACVAYSDRQYTPSERQKVRSELERIHGLSNEGIEGICKILDERIFDLTATSSQIYLRDLSELADYETKIDVLDVLMSLAAADESVSVVETNLLRRAATALGLSSDDYNTIQRRYRDKLAVLQKG